jgi:tryptophan synthase beta subunit
MKNLKQLPNKEGYFGEYGGQLIPEQLKPVFAEIEKAIYKHAGEEFNVRSTKQLREILFEKL